MDNESDGLNKNNQKKVYTAIAAFAILLIAAICIYFALTNFAVTTKENFVMPEIYVENFSITDISIESTEFDVIVSVNNTNNIGGEIDSLKFDIFLKDNEKMNYIASGNASRFTVSPAAVSIVHIPVTLKNSNLPELLSALYHEDTLTFTLNGTATAAIGALLWDVPFSETKSFPNAYKEKLNKAVESVSNILSGFLGA